CNGHAELCNRSYGNITFLGVHDSFAWSTDVLAQVDLPTQLALGARLLQGQTHMNGDAIHLCHTNCILFDGGPLVDYLSQVKTFLDANP
ncbi:hypothetical protein BDN72DRAFT_726645, partial [Pluteus cervinus]